MDTNQSSAYPGRSTRGKEEKVRSQQTKIEDRKAQEESTGKKSGGANTRTSRLLDSPGGQSEPVGCLTNRALSFYRTLNYVKLDKFLLRHGVSRLLILASAIHPEGGGKELLVSYRGKVIKKHLLRLDTLQGA